MPALSYVGGVAGGLVAAVVAGFTLDGDEPVEAIAALLLGAVASLAGMVAVALWLERRR